jgi:YbgC/YbaW family acyl-CoA thioester hydrolase
MVPFQREKTRRVTRFPRSAVARTHSRIAPRRVAAQRVCAMPHEFTLSHRVEFSETDMAGIVHFANYFRMMENAEHAFFRSLGFSIHGDVSGATIGWPRVATSCEYLKPLRFEDVVDIQLLVAEVRTRSIRYAFRFWKSDAGERVEIARGSVTAVCTTMDKITGKLAAVAIPDVIRAAIQPAPQELLGAPARSDQRGTNPQSR